MFAARDNVSIGSRAFLSTCDGAAHWAQIVVQNNSIDAGHPGAGMPIQFHLCAPMLPIGNEIRTNGCPAIVATQAYNAVAIGNR